MLLLNPSSVRFGDDLWDDATLIAIDRAPARLAENWSDLGPYQVFADAPEQRITIRIVRRLTRDQPPPPPLGTMAQLRFATSPSASDAGRRLIEATAVLIEVDHQLPGDGDPPSRTRARSASQTLTLVAISGDGADDPIVITAAPAAAP